MAKVEFDASEYGEKLASIRHNEAGEEVLDPTRRQPPLGHKKTVPLHLQIRQMVMQEKLRQIEMEPETEEEAEDFNVGEDFEPLSKYENDHIPSLRKLREKAKEINDQIKAAQRKKAVEDYQKDIGRRAGKDAPGQAAKEPSAKAQPVNPGAAPSPDQGGGEDLG